MTVFSQALAAAARTRLHLLDEPAHHDAQRHDLPEPAHSADSSPWAAQMAAASAAGAVDRPRRFDIAALFVATGGTYCDLAGVDPWDRERDARLYAGPHPVVAHPPCDRWCQMAPVNQARYGHRVGDDGGCFAAALAIVRRWGGVLEHPALSLAWAAFDLPRPPSSGGWVKGFCGGWAAHVEQRHYGHRARKATWLYCYGVEPPSLRWGRGPAPEAWISADRPRSELAARGIAQLSKREAKATPPEFRDVLIAIARGGEPVLPDRAPRPHDDLNLVSSLHCGDSLPRGAHK